MTEDEISTDDHTWLFTEDLTNFVFRNHIGFPITPIADECREFVRERFTETVRSAVEIVERKVSAEIEAAYLELSAKTDVIAAYNTYVSDLRKELRSGRFDGSKCLHYCVFVSCLGERFYRTGLEGFHYLAFAAVRKGLKMFGMSDDGEWGSLESAADVITTVAEESLPSESDEQSGLVNTGKKCVNRTLNILHEDVGRVRESSLSNESSSVENKSSDTESSAQSSDICSTSEDDSDDQYLVSLNKKLPQSNRVSSSTDISKFIAVSDSCSSDYSVDSTDTTHLKYTMNDSVDTLDLSKHSDRNESCSEFNLNATSSGRLILSVTRNKTGKNASKKVCSDSKLSSETESTEEEKGDLPRCPQVEQFSKQNSESGRFLMDSELSAEARLPDSAESPRSVSERSNDRSTCDEL